MKKILISSILLLLHFTTTAQNFGGHPLGLHWQILSSDAVRVIYPKGLEAEAQRIATLINHMDQNNRLSIGKKKRRIDIVLQNQTTNPNGYVALAPFRSEFFATPPQSNLFLGSMDWLDVLAIHEYRHVQQFTNGLRGLTLIGYVLAGEPLWAGLHFVSVPNWYFEGDAVVAETALTNTGRGRAPFFTLEQRALAFAGKDYSYAKNRNGSFKDLLPNHYPLGYMMLTKARKGHGNEVTKEVHKHAAAYRGIIYPFARAMRKYTGMGTTKLYNEAWADKKEDWKTELEKTDLIPTMTLKGKPKRTVTSYNFPRVLPDGNIVVRKRSYKKTDAIYLLKGEEEEFLTTIGYSNDRYLSEGGGYLAWTESSVDVRRGNQNFSDILLYHIESDKRIRLTKKTKYFSPAVSPDGKEVAVIQIEPQLKNEILILDIHNGAVKRKINNPDNYTLSRVVWTPDGKSIVSIAKKDSKIAIVKFNMAEQTITELSDWTGHTISAPSVRGDRVFFNASFSGIDNIYFTDLAGSKVIRQITSVPVGAFEPAATPDGKSIVFTEFTEMGRILSKQDLDESQVREVNITEPHLMEKYQTVANDSEGGNILKKVQTGNYETESYKGLFKGLKLHTWGFTPSIATPTLQVQLTNMLNDVDIKLGGGINRNEDNQNFYNAAVTIGRYLPEFTLRGELASRETDFYGSSSFADTISTQTFRETIFGTDVAIPLGWQHGNYRTSLIPRVGINWHDINNVVVAELFDKSDYDFLSYNLGFSFASLRRQAFQNVGPRAGVVTNLEYRKGLEEDTADKIYMDAAIYAPGLHPNHNLKISVAYQKESADNNYQYSDRFVYIRGYDSFLNNEFRRFSVDYGLPLLYPDFGIMGLTYFKRIRANMFYDVGVGQIPSGDMTAVSVDFSSVGLEIIFDNTVINLLPVSLGLRQSYLLENRLDDGTRYPFELFFGVEM